MRESRNDTRWQPPWHVVLAVIGRESRFAALRYGLAPDERDELHQRMCLRVVREIRSFDPDHGGSTLESWVGKHAGWAVGDYWRERMRHLAREHGLAVPEAVLGGTRSPHEEAHNGELRSALERCLGRLTPTQRDRFSAAERCLGRRGSLKSLAASLGISYDALRESIARARVLLRRCLVAGGFAPPRMCETAADAQGESG